MHLKALPTFKCHGNFAFTVKILLFQCCNVISSIHSKVIFWTSHVVPTTLNRVLSIGPFFAWHHSTCPTINTHRFSFIFPLTSALKKHFLNPYFFNVPKFVASHKEAHNLWHLPFNSCLTINTYPTPPRLISSYWRQLL
jgi:hypothetical protein